MNDSNACFRKESSLNELLHEPIIAMLMTSDGVRSDDIRALYRKMAEKHDGMRQRAQARDITLLERCFRL
ncbi:hypothetical protein OSH11_14395 [Kaistia dalseonensis]|uniref:NAD-dependent epimerase/dehydratase family protein n=1 Tax=Kaistia dalseonensis TaxID=410840 RepID=A0ABU0H863_9HYPH|nr:hypothetical protein [Kaistia dalseonensis]MCX5495899.1 hypothetical protein [Kaistia dalseonensis]MDQ0438502.1 putative NAD-dependent epimerase/dehydratase family protein [Kaistia dalseonensis]